MNVFKRFEKHWVYGLVTLLAAWTAVIWGICSAVMVAPRDFAIAEKDKQIANLRVRLNELRTEHDLEGAAHVTEEEWVGSDGRRFLSGRVLISVESVFPALEKAEIAITVQDQRPLRWRVHGVPARRKLSIGDATYFVDVIQLTDAQAKVGLSRKP